MDLTDRAAYAAGCGVLAGAGVNVVDSAIPELVVGGGLVAHIAVGVGVALYVFGGHGS